VSSESHRIEIDNLSGAVSAHCSASTWTTWRGTRLPKAFMRCHWWAARPGCDFLVCPWARSATRWWRTQNAHTAPCGDQLDAHRRSPSTAWHRRADFRSSAGPSTCSLLLPTG